MKRVALVSSEPIRAQMAGIGIRYLEFARRLPAHDLEAVLISPSSVAELPAFGGEGRSLADGSIAELVADCDVVVAQGQQANNVAVECPHKPKVFDLYDPWLVENLHYHETLGLDVYRNDHASWMLQLSEGDFFLCSSEEQRLFYLGLLTSLGRVNPENVKKDPDMGGLIAAVPFGMPTVLPPQQTLLPPPASGEKRILFGGLYDWYDPWTLIQALDQLPPEVRVLFVANPNAESTPQRLLAEIESECRRRGWWGNRVALVPWVEADRRFDLLREVDLLVAPHRPSLETRLSLRTRFLDGLASGCPVILTEGGTMSRLIMEYDAGWVVPPSDPSRLAATIRKVLSQPKRGGTKAKGAAQLVADFSWDKVLTPLIAFCRNPQVDSTRKQFCSRLPTTAPPDSFIFRVRRWLRRQTGKLS